MEGCFRSVSWSGDILWSFGGRVKIVIENWDVEGLGGEMLPPEIAEIFL